ncbi:hypothetical protein GCM10010156_21930 [Planobispora rosea]|uniref:Secreted protein n=1 Tax=Planobispora rosea TaxID=35762 RepID=A0A8J3S3E5_PLARO|nr:hypothetical protein GCM10010156_21930 [Planobispora rosea]GIH84294.1 hypothetical protein Pro02_27020 [Planobispora rosea]
MRGVLAAAALVAGVSWLTAAPAAGAADGQRVPRGNGLVVPAVERLARTAGLPGLSRASALISVADAGGVAAGLGFPALPFGVPGHPGLRWVEMLSPIPDLPGLPGAPAVRACLRQCDTSSSASSSSSGRPRSTRIR